MRIGIIIAGIVTLAIGGDIWINNGGVLYMQPVPKHTGIALIFIGIFLLGLGIFKPQYLVKKSYICPKCEETIERTGTKEISCPECGTKMEKLKGFFGRHPEKQ